MIGLTTILMVLAVICFLIAAVGGGWPGARFNMLAWGLFFWSLTIVLGGRGILLHG
jgi:DNA-binding transcriptional regulator of glucitol operon